MLTVEKLTAGYGRSDVLHGVDFNVGEGKLVAIIGGNGAGKTTTMRALSGMIATTSGRIVLGATAVSGLQSHAIAHLGIAHVPEGRRVFPNLTVRDNLRLGTYTWPIPNAADIETELNTTFQLFSRLSERRYQLAGTLSGGEQQMLAIGRALMARPKVILMDEPSLGLAPKLVDEVYAIIRHLKKQGRTMVLVEQFANIALKVADYAYVLENGRITFSGTADELLKDERVRQAYIGHVVL